LVARSALDRPELAQPALKLCRLVLEQARKTSTKDLIAHVGFDLARPALAGLTADQRARVQAPSFKLWAAATPPQTSEGTYPPVFWSAHDGHLVHHAGCEYDALYFKYPLTGHFEFSYETYTAYYSQSELGYGGIICAPQFNPRRTIVWPVSQHEQILRPAQLENLEGWNRIAVRVSPERVRFFVNGHLAFEDASPSRTSPWLHLQALSLRQPALRNLRLSGAPTIPREVALLDADRLEGWNARFYRESMPARLQKSEATDAVTASDGRRVVLRPDGSYVEVGFTSAESDWLATGGVLTGRADSAVSPRAQSRIFYHRPLLDGERIRYQFFYQPGQTHAHPTLGRIAFLLEPEGVRLHWMARSGDVPGGETIEPLLVDPRNSVDDPTCRRGPATLPLKAGEWNDVEVSVNGGTAAIRLNGELVCERPIELTSDWRFGLFHFKGQTAVEVRSVVLSGNWPQSLTPSELANLLALSEPDDDPALRRARHALLGDRILAGHAYEVWQRSCEMTGSDKFEFLKRWVLPDPSHPTVRLAVDWTPTDPPPGALPNGGRTEGRFQHAGGELVSPALELVAVAKELNKLDELAAAAALAAKELPDQARSAAAFEALLAIARGDNAAAASRLKQSLEFVKQQPADTPVHERHAEYLAAYAALARPALHSAALALAEQLVNDQKAPRNIGLPWERRVRRLRLLAQSLANPATAGQPFGESPRMAQWLPANRPTAQSRGEGSEPPAWRLAPGEANYLTGNARDALYFAMPLTGNFELRCERSTFGWREIRPLYAGVAFDPKSDGLAVQRQEVGRGQSVETPLSEKIKGWGPAVRYRLVVTDGTMTAYVNDQQVASEPLPADADPWLAIETRNGHFAGVVRNVQILGSPSIPREVPLSASASLAGWAADYYGESAGAQNTTWTRKADEIVAAKLADCEGSFRESILQYHRPLLEDGELQYEFFYETGKTEVHPAVDRLVFLLDPAGTKIHWLTDAQYDRTGTAPDNSQPLAGAAVPPLKSGEWNKLKLTLAGDEVTVAVNGAQVARRKLEGTNQRTFGLFRYADVSGVRVRNIVYRGQWPLELPPVAKQELAAAKP
jgi:hypothetical protein